MKNDMQTSDEILLEGYTFFDLLDREPILGDIDDDKCWPVSI
ncbi:MULTISPECIES: hypothetical protein [unclassified Sphingobacterium]|jgi:hypothetical protein|nr:MULTISPECIES: hypothetical protein [unclassified Sphingobacterium]MCS3552746.1 hypothetical protein [Sphingobacterium sp. JUb21]TCR10496.1 hypothetical protein EDF66_101310 [Sphingobacterium sp. JUb20]